METDVGIGDETDNPFEKVLDRLREKGWFKGSFWPYGSDAQNGPFCMLGAVPNPLLDTWPEHIVDGIIRDQYGDRIMQGYRIIPTFNDHRDTTFSDVERVLEKAAVKWEEEKVMRDV